MRRLKAVVGVFVMVLVGAALATAARAQTVGSVTNKTTVTISHPMEIPGGKILQPGTYVFRLVDFASNRNIMRITNQDDNQVIATFLAIPNYRLHATEKSVVEYKEEAAGKPIAMRAWFFAADVGGLEFVYPKARAVELAEENHEYVPAETTEVSAESMKTVPLIAITPEGKEEAVSQAFDQKAEAPTEVAQTLPKTASPVPLIALLGGTFLAIGFGLKRLAIHS